MLLARHETGESIEALSQACCISESGLRDLLVIEDVVIRKPPMTPEDVELAVWLYESGLTVRQVVKRVGYSFGTVRRVLHEQGVAMRANGVRKEAEPIVDSP